MAGFHLILSFLCFSIYTKNCLLTTEDDAIREWRIYFAEKNTSMNEE